MAEVARELGVSDISLAGWVKDAQRRSPETDAERADRAEAARLRKRVRELEEEIDILKRVTSYWVRGSAR
ncbi:MAG: transposase [Acidimicrobiales bacterium]